MLFTETGNRRARSKLRRANGKSNLDPFVSGQLEKRVKDSEKEKSPKCGEKEAGALAQKPRERIQRGKSGQECCSLQRG